MAAEGEIYLGPTGDEDLISNQVSEVKRPYEEFGRSDRTWDGDLKTDITSRKYTFSIVYRYISQETLDIIVEKRALDVDLNLRMYISDSEYFENFSGNCPIVRILPFSSSDFMKAKAKKLYKDVTIKFIEV